MLSKNIIKSPSIDLEKTNSDIQSIKKLSNFSQALKWRMVVYGGYGLDGYLKTATRNHGDIDLVFFGQLSRKEALAKIASYLKKEVKGVIVESKDEDFLIDIKIKSKVISGNFYYVQTAEDPHQNLNAVIKLDGSKVVNSPSQFPPPVAGQIGELKIEVQDQNAHLADILRKRASDSSYSKHDQDIENIKLNT